MKIFSRKQRDAPSSSSQSAVALWLNSEDAKNILCPEGYTPLSQNDVVCRCAHKIADMVSNMTIYLMQNGKKGDTRIKNELSRVIDITPNQIMTRKTFVYKLVDDMVKCGNAVALPSYNGTLLESMTWLDASAASYSDLDSDGHYFITISGKRYRDDEVLHFVLIPDKDKPWRGVGYAPQIAESVKTYLQANATKTGFLRSKWKPSMIISINADTEELQDPEKRKKILGSYASETERGEPWLIPAGELDIKTIQPLTLQDLAIQDSITLDIRTIAGAIGLPPFLLGIGEFNKDAYNNFVSSTIRGFAEIIQQEYTRKLLYSEKWYFKMSEKSLLHYTLTEKQTYVAGMVQNAMMTRNEGRNEFDLAPSDAAGMDDFAVLENYIKVGDIDKQKKLNKGGAEGG